MKTEEYKALFKGIPERAWLSQSLQSVINGEEYHELMELLRGTKNIDDVKEIEKLYQIKASFFKLSVLAQKIHELIDELDLAFLGEFEDKTMTMEEIGIATDDVFECVSDFTYHDMIKINAGSTIKVMELSFAGKNSQLYCKFINHETDETTRKHFPNSDDINMLFSLSEFEERFNKID